MNSLTKQMYRLLPVQILLAAISAVNGIVSTFFASNYVGIDAMTAVGLYGPLTMLQQAITMMLVGGSVIMCGKYMGKNQQERLQNNFSLTLLICFLTAAVLTVILLLLSVLDLTGIFTSDKEIRPLFNLYVIGQVIGIIPMMIGNYLSSFLSLFNERKRTMIASLVYIAFNLLLNIVFVMILHMNTFGLALANSIGLWAFFAVQAQYFFRAKARLRIFGTHLSIKEAEEIIHIGLPGAAANGYQTARGLIVNWLLTVFVGSVGVSAFATASNCLTLFWAVPCAMQAVSRMMISVSIGEEDRQTLTDIMRVMFRRFIPMQCGISLLLIILAVPLTHIFYQDPSEPVYMMTVWGIRILPICIPLSIILMHFVCYGQAMGREAFVHLMSFLDGVLCVVVFTALLIPTTGQNSVYIANILNGVVTTIVIIGYAYKKNGRFPTTMEELMVIPDNFGASAENRMDLTVRTIWEVTRIAEQVQCFCRSKGIDERRSYLAGLFLEEMAGNVVEHGFTKDSKEHSIEIRVVRKDDDVILRIRDDCVPFDPGDRRKVEEGDVLKNIGIRMVFKIATDVQYQNILGMNVLTIRI